MNQQTCRFVALSGIVRPDIAKGGDMAVTRTHGRLGTPVAPAVLAVSSRRPAWQRALLALVPVGVAVLMLSTAHQGVASDPRIASPAGVASRSNPLWGVEDWPSLLTRGFVIGAGLGLAAGFALRRWRNIDLTRHGALFFALTGICVLDPLGNWATYAAFDPRLTHFPTDWPWVSAAPGIEPLIAMVAYPVYFFAPAFFAWWLYQRLIWSRARPESFAVCHPLIGLFAVGLAVGIVWDISVQLFMLRVELYTYTQYFGPALHWGIVRLPLKTVALDAAILAAAAMLMWVDDAGRSVGQRLAQRSRLRGRPLLGGAVYSWAILSAVYVASMVPLGVIRLTDSAVHLSTPWPYPETKTYDPHGRWAESGQPGPFYPGILSLSGGR
jgi:hypothetical protein